MADLDNQIMKSLSPHIKPPVDLLKPLVINSRRLMTPGPTNMSDRVIASQIAPLLALNDPQYYRILNEVSDGIRYAFQTRNLYSLAITGSATCAMETAICNILERGDTFMVAVHGYWGHRAGLMGVKHGCNVVELTVERFGTILSLNQIEEALKKHKPKLLYVCHGESSTGVLQPLDGIGECCHRYNCLLLVDAVVSLCCAPLNTDLMNIDAVFSGAQKALSGPPGISLLSLSDRAVNAIKNRKTEIDSFYMDIHWLAKAWSIDNNSTFVYHTTPAVSLIYGLREALSLVAEEGVANVIARHVRTSLTLEKFVQQLGLELYVAEPSHRLPGILTVLIPDDLDEKFVVNYLRENYDISILGGLGPTGGKVWRIGSLGINANQTEINQLCLALRETVDICRTRKRHSQL